MSKKSTRSALFSYARWFAEEDTLLLVRSYSNIFGEDLQVYTTSAEEASSGFRYLSYRHIEYTSCGNSNGIMTRKHSSLAVIEVVHKKKEAGYDIEGKEENIEFSFADRSFSL